ncbi:MAG: 4-hydroxy-3-methylbut-2-enyl diphosphate reductase [Planctomycetota bacterium]
MKILFPKHFGMCFGVRDAIEATEHITNPETVTIYGELVHNPIIKERLAARGFVQFTERGRADSPATLPSTSHVLITAHGISGAERGKLASEGLRLIDTTCPLVRNAHAAALTLASENRLIIIVGLADHVEVRGLTGDLREYVVIASAEEAKKYDHDRIGILSQTTTHPAVFAAAARKVKLLNPQADVRVIDTICKPTRDRQESLDDLLTIIDALVVVGGKHSRNTKELAATAERAGVRTLHIENVNEIDKAWFSGMEAVGLTAGTSTLPETLDEIHQFLQTIETEVKL